MQTHTPTVVQRRGGGGCLALPSIFVTLPGGPHYECETKCQTLFRDVEQIVIQLILLECEGKYDDILYPLFFKVVMVLPHI